MDYLKLRKVGNSLVVTIPTPLIEHYGLKEGDAFRVGKHADGIKLRTGADKLSRQLAMAEQIMDEHSEALAILAR